MISWNRENEGPVTDFGDTRFSDDGKGILVITEVQASDSGTYICKATDGIYVLTDHGELSVGNTGTYKNNINDYF